MTCENTTPRSCFGSTRLDEILNCAGQIAAEITAADAEEIDRDGRWPERSIRALQQAGLGGLVVDRAQGGLGHGALALVRVMEVLGAECPSTALCFGMHCVGTAVIAKKATPEQQVKYLKPIAEGRHLTTIALSEPGTGAHFYLPETRLEAVKEFGYRVTGKKSFVTNGGFADSYVVSTVAADPAAPPGQFSCALLHNDSSGMEWQEAWTGIGMRGNSSRGLRINGVKVPSSDLIGAEGDQIWYIFNVVAPYFLTAMAGTYLGLASKALELASEHLQKRIHSDSGLSLGQIPVLQHRLGTLWGTLERTRQLVYYAARQLDDGGSDSLLAVCSAKAEVADCATTIVNEAMTLMGGIGYQKSGRIERLLRDARAAHVMAPTTDILRTWVGRALLGQPLLAD